MDNLLSIIVPVYNVEDFLKACLDSILSQAYKNIEVIVIDDGSEDNSRIICDEYQKQDKRIHVIHTTNGGPGRALNIGLDIASGEFITFVDSDDYISSDVYSGNIPFFFKNREIDVIQYPFRKFPEGEMFNVPSKMIFSKKELFKEAYLYKRLRSYKCHKIFRRQIFKDLRFNESILWEDRALLPHIIEKCNGILYSEIGCYFYRQREGQITRNIHSLQFIPSQIFSNLLIIDVLKKYDNTLPIILEKYSEALFWNKRSPMNFFGEIKKRRPDLFPSFCCKAPIGHKFNVFKTFW